MELSEDDVLHILKLIDESKFDYFQLEVGELKITVSKGDPIPLAGAAPQSIAPSPAPAAAKTAPATAPVAAAPAPASQARGDSRRHGRQSPHRSLALFTSRPSPARRPSSKSASRSPKTPLPA